MRKQVLIPIADGIEEIEAVCLIDILRRAGAAVTVASVGTLEIVASRGVRLIADCTIEECVDKHYDLVALPGGIPGAENLRDSAFLITILKNQFQAGRWYGAICASPAIVLYPHQLLSSQATCHPHFMDNLKKVQVVNDRVIVDGICVTSQAPGTAIEFALKLVEVLYGPEKAQDVAKPMLVVYSTES